MTTDRTTQNRLPLIFSIVALAVSLVGLYFRRPAHVTGPTGRPSVPIVSDGDGDAAANCDGDQPASTLPLLMRHRINPALTHLSYALHHDKRDADARLSAVATNASGLLGCIRKAGALAPQMTLDNLPEYYRMLSGMEENALGLRIAALEKDEEGARHWFNHLKQACANCHSRFRIESVQIE